MKTAHGSTGDHGWIASIAQAMGRNGYRLIRAERGTMDSGVAVFSNGTDEIEVTRDRSQWMLQGLRKDLEPHGLFRAHNDDGSFIDALHHWIQVRRCEPDGPANGSQPICSETNTTSSAAASRR